MLILSLILILLALLGQKYLGRLALRYLDCGLSCDTALAEPGEPIQLVMHLKNTGPLPILFFRAFLSLPKETEVPEELADKLTDHMNMKRFEYSGYLLPKGQLDVTIPVILPVRGRYSFGGISLYAGDLFGLDETRTSYDCSRKVTVIPKRAESAPTEEIAGGLLGEISVRRWIHEDPILSAGYHEYTGREPQKAIAWNRSLSSGQLMVRSYDHTAEPRGNILLLMDGTPEHDAIEKSFSLARTVCEDFERRRIPYAFRTNANMYSYLGWLDAVEAGLGDRHLSMILDGLGRATYLIRMNPEVLVNREIRSRNMEGFVYLWITPTLTPHLQELAEQFEARTGCHVHLCEAGT